MIRARNATIMLTAPAEADIRRRPVHVGGDLNDHMPVAATSWKVIVLSIHEASKFSIRAPPPQALATRRATCAALGVAPEPRPQPQDADVADEDAAEVEGAEEDGGPGPPPVVVAADPDTAAACAREDPDRIGIARDLFEKSGGPCLPARGHFRLLEVRFQPKARHRGRACASRRGGHCLAVLLQNSTLVTCGGLAGRFGRLGPTSCERRACASTS